MSKSKSKGKSGHDELYDQKTNKDIKILDDFLHGEKLPKAPPRVEKFTGRVSEGDQQLKQRIAKIIDSQNASVRLED